MLLILRPGTALHPVGVAFVLLTVACNVVFQLLTRKLAASESSLATIFLTALVGVAVSTALLPAQQLWGGWPPAFDAELLLLMASLGVTGAISQWCLIRAYYWSSASFVAPLVFLQLVWATLAGWVFFGDLPDRLTLSAIAIICASGAASALAERRRSLGDAGRSLGDAGPHAGGR